MLIIPLKSLSYPKRACERYNEQKFKAETAITAAAVVIL
jgi:hypothetical protein